MLAVWRFALLTSPDFWKVFHSRFLHCVFFCLTRFAEFQAAVELPALNTPFNRTLIYLFIFIFCLFAGYLLNLSCAVTLAWRQQMKRPQYWGAYIHRFGVFTVVVRICVRKTHVRMCKRFFSLPAWILRVLPASVVWTPFGWYEFRACILGFDSS